MACGLLVWFNSEDGFGGKESELIKLQQQSKKASHSRKPIN